MNIDKFEDAIMNCRFCFMCRHLSAIGNVRFTEVDTPRIRAAMIYGLRTGTNSFDDSDFIDALIEERPMPVSPMEGASTVAVCRATVESARTGMPVDIVYPQV